jgi:hypothetical protein
MNNTSMTLRHLWILTKTAPSLLCLWSLYSVNLLTATSKILWLDPFTKHGMIMSSHSKPNGLCNTEENAEPSTYHQTGSTANLGNHHPLSLMKHLPHLPLVATIPETTDDDQSDQLSLLPTGINPTFDEHAPIQPTWTNTTYPHHVNLAHHQHHHSILQKMMTIYFQEQFYKQWHTVAARWMKNTQSLLSTSRGALSWRNAHDGPITLQENLLTVNRPNLCARGTGFARLHASTILSSSFVILALM